MYTQFLSSSNSYIIEAHSLFINLVHKLHLTTLITTTNNSLIFNFSYIYYYFFTVNIFLLTLTLLAYFNLNLLNTIYYYVSLISIVFFGFITQAEFLAFTSFVYF